LPMAFGVATLATAVWIGRRWMRTAGASALAFLCAFGQWLSFHALELKHYSADAFFALLLPALAARALTPRRGADAPRARDDDRLFDTRIVVWWVVAAVAQWIANGGLFVAPVCALVLVLTAARRRGCRGAVTAGAPGLIWLACFAINYRITLA